MTEAIRAQLRRSLLSRYRELTVRLARRLGSSDLAAEALHETWLRLERPGDLASVTNPEAYLYRAALNIATNIRVAERRRLTAVELDALMEFPDDAPGPAQIAEGRADLARLEQAMSELPPRQRAVFTQALLEDISYESLAKRHGVTVRTIHNDIRHAIEHCADRLGRDGLFAFGRRQLSKK
jgi:RNA polymerase sigma factor (sigma-70 family)